MVDDFVTNFGVFGRIEGAAFAAEVFFGDGGDFFGEAVFPWVGSEGDFLGGRGSEEGFLIHAVDVFPFDVGFLAKDFFGRGVLAGGEEGKEG